MNLSRDFKRQIERAFGGFATDHRRLPFANAVHEVLIGAGLAKPSYVAAQGAALQRAGRVYLRKDGGEVWVGGDVVEVVRGEICLQS